MSFTIACPSCGLNLSVPDEARGQQGKCSRCGAVFQIEQPYAPPATFAPAVLPADVTPGMIRFGDGLSRGFTLLHCNLGTFVLVGLSFLGIQIGMGIMQQIPLLGILVALANSFVIGPALQAGWYRTCFTQHDGGAADVGQLFSEFRLWVDLLLLVLVQMGISIAAMLLPGIVVLVPAISMIVQSQNQPGFTPEPWQIVMLVLGGLLIFVIAVFLGMVFQWSYPALVDRRRGFWDAITTSWNLMKANPLGTFGTGFVGGLIGMLGVLACCVGLIYTIPAYFCIVAATYRTGMPGQFVAAAPLAPVAVSPAAPQWPTASPPESPLT